MLAYCVCVHILLHSCLLLAVVGAGDRDGRPPHILHHLQDRQPSRLQELKVSDRDMLVLESRCDPCDCFNW